MTKLLIAVLLLAVATLIGVGGNADAAPQPADTYAVHMTQSRETGDWTPRATYRTCTLLKPMQVGSRAISVVVIAVSRRCADIGGK